MTIDVHCHHVVIVRDNGGYVHSPSGFMARSLLTSLGILNWQEAFFARLPTQRRLDALYRDNLIRRIDESPLDHAIVLAMDGIYDERGYLDHDSTKNYVSNEAILALRRDSPKVLFGASVNPKRRDWRDELERCIAEGAVLLKWLPNVMGFDPSDPDISAFYARLVEVGMPLLSHVGFEYSLPVVNESFSDLDRMVPALEAGVTVIAAHCGGGRILIDSPAMYRKLQEMVERFPNLYLDVSAMASLHRKQRFLRVINDDVVKDRLLYGTDFPIPVHPWAFKKWLAGVEIPENDFAKDMTVKVAVGLDTKALDRGYRVIGKRLDAHCACTGCTPFSSLGLTES